MMTINIITDGQVEKYFSFGSFPITKINSSIINPMAIPDNKRFVWKLLLLYNISMLDIIIIIIP